MQPSSVPTTVGHWLLPVVPEGWQFVPEHGLKPNDQNLWTCNIAAAEEPLPCEKELKSYISDQINILRHFVPDVDVIGPKESHFPDVEAAQEVVLRYKTTSNLEVVQGQIYVLTSGQVGVLTFTATAEHLKSSQPAFSAVRSSARFKPEPIPRDAISVDNPQKL